MDFSHMGVRVDYAILVMVLNHVFTGDLKLSGC